MNQNDLPPSNLPRTPRLSSLETLKTQLRRERLLFITETLNAHGHDEPVAITAFYTLTPAGPELTGVALDEQVWDSPHDMLGNADRRPDGGSAFALKEVLEALVREDQGTGPQRDGQRTYLLPTPQRTELAYSLNGHLYVPEGSVVNEAAPGQPLMVTLPGGETFVLQALIEGQTAGVSIQPGPGTLTTLGPAD